MKIKSINIYPLAIPMRIRFAQANSQSKVSDSVIVKLTTEQATIGYGESCPRPYVTGECTEEVITGLYAIQAELCRYSFHSIDCIRQFTCAYLPALLKPAAICALELALLDAWSKEHQTPLLTALGGRSPAVVKYTGVVPYGKISAITPVLKRFDFEEIKLKASADVRENMERIAQVRELYPDGIKLRMDANCGWNFPTAMEQCRYLVEANVSCIEQPFPATEDKAMAAITRYYAEWIDVMADESLTDYQSAERLIGQQACNRFNLKISKNGGLLNTLRIYELAQQHNIKCQLGAHFGETSILTAAGYLFASIARQLEAVEGGLGTHLLEYDITHTTLQISGKAVIRHPIHKSPGLGVAVAENLLPCPEKNTFEADPEMALL